jgi:hypothetical protein
MTFQLSLTKHCLESVTHTHCPKLFHLLKTIPTTHNFWGEACMSLFIYWVQGRPTRIKVQQSPAPWVVSDEIWCHHCEMEVTSTECSQNDRKTFETPEHLLIRQ